MTGSAPALETTQCNASAPHDSPIRTAPAPPGFRLIVAARGDDDDDAGTFTTLIAAVDVVSFGTGNAALVTADIGADNGVIHLIDGVITEAG